MIIGNETNIFQSQFDETNNQDETKMLINHLDKTQYHYNVDYQLNSHRLNATKNNINLQINKTPSKANDLWE